MELINPYIMTTINSPKGPPPNKVKGLRIYPSKKKLMNQHCPVCGRKLDLLSCLGNLTDFLSADLQTLNLQIKPVVAALYSLLRKVEKPKLRARRE